jgi:acetyl-CoA carboxylase carboxyl transferase subunit alpha
LKALGLVDRIVHEPLGGAHRDHDAMMQALKKALHETWLKLREKPIAELASERYEKLMAYGKFKEVEAK